MSVNKDAEIMKLIYWKLQIDGSVLQKIEVFSHSGVAFAFLKNGHKVAEIIGRLNFFKDDQNWSSMLPNPLNFLYYYEDENEVEFS